MKTIEDFDEGRFTPDKLSFRAYVDHGKHENLPNLADDGSIKVLINPIHYEGYFDQGFEVIHPGFYEKFWDEMEGVYGSKLTFDETVAHLESIGMTRDDSLSLW